MQLLPQQQPIISTREPSFVDSHVCETDAMVEGSGSSVGFVLYRRRYGRYLQRLETLSCGHCFEETHKGSTYAFTMDFGSNSDPSQLHGLTVFIGTVEQESNNLLIVQRDEASLSLNVSRNLLESWFIEPSGMKRLCYLIYGLIIFALNLSDADHNVTRVETMNCSQDSGGSYAMEKEELDAAGDQFSVRMMVSKGKLWWAHTNHTKRRPTNDGFRFRPTE